MGYSLSPCVSAFLYIFVFLNQFAFSVVVVQGFVIWMTVSNIMVMFSLIIYQKDLFAEKAQELFFMPSEITAFLYGLLGGLNYLLVGIVAPIVMADRYSKT